MGHPSDAEGPKWVDFIKKDEIKEIVRDELKTIISGFVSLSTDGDNSIVFDIERFVDELRKAGGFGVI